jgi:protein TonB
MKKAIIYFLFTGLTIPAIQLNAQQTETPAVYTTVEKKPQFPGGEVQMNKYIQTNLKYPADAKKNKISGTVYISFVVDASGAITQILPSKEVEGDIEHSLSKEAIRIVSAMPSWKPGYEKGKAVAVKYEVPVRFELKK